MEFEIALRNRASAVRDYLDKALALGPRPAARLLEAMRYAVLDGGKGLRPFFLIESASLFGVPEASAVPAAAALECVHCYSLVHDDLPAMDDDDTRRGRAATHIAFGEATAILAGDALLTYAFEILASEACHPDPAVRTALALALARAAGVHGMAGGQALDMDADGRTDDRTTDHVLMLQAMKTGTLFSFALEAGAVLGYAAPEERAALGIYASRIGLAFQIADDLLDRIASSEGAGKRTGKDRGKGKATFVDIEGIERANERAKRLVDEAVAVLEPFGPRAVLLRRAARFILDRGK